MNMLCEECINRADLPVLGTLWMQIAVWLVVVAATVAVGLWIAGDTRYRN